VPCGALAAKVTRKPSRKRKSQPDATESLYGESKDKS
jgi:hypothetical protein